MMINLTAGILSLLLFLLSEKDSFFLVEALLLFAVGVLIPLCFPLINDVDRNGKRQPTMVLIRRLYFIAPLSVAAAFLLDIEGLYLIWVLFTLLLAAAAVLRVLERGVQIIEETAIDTAFLYLPLGSLWLLAYGMKFDVLGFSGLIVLLTAIHFHYSAFAIPLFTGMLKRRTTSFQTLHNSIAVIVIASPMTIALGITYSDFLEFTSVLIYTVAIYLYAFLVFKYKWKSYAGKIPVILSSVILISTISFSLVYSFGAVTPFSTLTISEMIYIHGLTNAIGVTLLGLIGWNIERPTPPYNHLGKPFSLIRGGEVIGFNFLSNNGLLSEKKYQGLTDRMSVYKSEHFVPSELHPLIADFYENTNDYQLKAVIKWKKWFYPLAAVYEWISRRTGQIHLGRGGKEESMYGDLIGVKALSDGRPEVRAWRRTNEKGEPVFLALYSHHRSMGETYMNIALPLPFSSMTGILKARNRGNGLLLTSRLRSSKCGDEGIYISFCSIHIRLPLTESFLLNETSESTLAAHHQMWIFGVPFLEITYHIRKTSL
ncbi:YndJ family protein [Bacillus salacetis]|uniref:YndJ family protein n=1 Tax=Bacillus salacetis TaxID=2315464 RepID=UPI003B9E710B